MLIRALILFALSTSLASAQSPSGGEPEAASPATSEPEPAPPALAPREAWRPRMLLQIDPLTMAIGFLHAQLEVASHPQLSIYLSPHLRLFDGILPDLHGEYVGLGLEAVVRWFPGGAAPTGFWVGPRAVLAQLWSDTDRSVGGYLSVLGGYSWLLEDRWVLALGLGLTYIDYRIDGGGAHGFLPAAHTGVGVAF
ncbi:MAG: hypothetical protein OEY14_13705 [Myxococcales bacterium]|nr:hypothetical protein [Myxococcales bacterium]